MPFRLNTTSKERYLKLNIRDELFSELFSYTTICSSFKWTEPLFCELSCTQPDSQTHRHTDKQTDMSTL